MYFPWSCRFCDALLMGEETDEGRHTWVFQCDTREHHEGDIWWTVQSEYCREVSA